MPLFAIAFMNFYDNKLDITFLRAASWREALIAFNSSQSEPWELPDTDNLEEVKTAFFDGDAMIDIKEVPNA